MSESPKDLISRSVKRLRRPATPTLNQALAGDRVEPALSAERREGVRLAGVIGSRYFAEAEAEHFARQKARQDREAARDAALNAEIDRRLREAI